MGATCQCKSFCPGELANSNIQQAIKGGFSD